MKTTQLIDLLKKYECGAVTGRPREVYFEVDDRIIKTDGIEFIEAGDGLVTDLTLSLPDAKPHWIPCSERLPEEDEDVLLQFSSNMGVGFYRDGWAVNTGEGIYSVVGISEEKPIAWMPLPKPYGGESE